MYILYKNKHPDIAKLPYPGVFIKKNYRKMKFNILKIVQTVLYFIRYTKFN